MNQQANTAIAVLDEMIKEFYFDSARVFILNEAKSRIQALGDGWIPFETPPEKEGIYLTYGDDLNNNVGPRIMNYVNGSFECGDGAECPTHWQEILPPITK